MAAHTLNGSARAVGAWALAALADRAETLLGAGDGDGVASLMADVVIAAQAARAAALGRRAAL
jgi:HPt (histidine-containing phosphotransfer) domain-containing protein